MDSAVAIHSGADGLGEQVAEQVPGRLIKDVRLTVEQGKAGALAQVSEQGQVSPWVIGGQALDEGEVDDADDRAQRGQAAEQGGFTAVLEDGEFRHRFDPA